MASSRGTRNQYIDIMEWKDYQNEGRRCSSRTCYHVLPTTVSMHHYRYVVVEVGSTVVAWYFSSCVCDWNVFPTHMHACCGLVECDPQPCNQLDAWCLEVASMYGLKKQGAAGKTMATCFVLFHCMHVESWMGKQEKQSFGMYSFLIAEMLRIERSNASIWASAWRPSPRH